MPYVFTPTDIIGIFGVSILLVFFVLNQTRRISTENLWYDVGNAVGAALLVVYAYLLHSVPFMILEGAWALLSLRDVVTHFKKT